MKPDISIVIEWENFILADMGRSFRMLEKLREQIHALHKAVEVIVLFNPEQIEGAVLEKELFDRLKSNETNLPSGLRVEEAYG
jgi:hypothetical protein